MEKKPDRSVRSILRRFPTCDVRRHSSCNDDCDYPRSGGAGYDRETKRLKPSFNQPGALSKRVRRSIGPSESKFRSSRPSPDPLIDPLCPECDSGRWKTLRSSGDCIPRRISTSVNQSQEVYAASPSRRRVFQHSRYCTLRIRLPDFALTRSRAGVSRNRAATLLTVPPETSRSASGKRRKQSWVCFAVVYLDEGFGLGEKDEQLLVPRVGLLVLQPVGDARHNQLAVVHAELGEVHRLVPHDQLRPRQEQVVVGAITARLRLSNGAPSAQSELAARLTPCITDGV
eukprot:637007-Prorocentrum_minimum.AAC.1